MWSARVLSRNCVTAIRVPISWPSITIRASEVNQLNRIKLMLSVAKERLGQSGGTPPQGGAAEKVPVYGGMEVPAVHVPGFAEKLPANG